MKRAFTKLLAVCLVAAMATAAYAGQSVEIRLRDGSKWRGEVSEMVELTVLEQRVEVPFSGRLVKAADLYIIVEGQVAGVMRQKTIFRDDIVRMRSIGSDDGGTVENETAARSGAKPTGTSKSGEPAPVDVAGKPMGVFVLPLEGTVGTSFRKDEIIEIGKKADEYGPGQIIVLIINSNGGSALESQYIADTIFDIRERHRVVAWIKKAISAGCQTAMCCQEIYFMTEGSAGAVTTWDGQGTSIKGAELERSMEHLADIAKRSGYSEYIARAMKTNHAMCSYDKDPETGEVTFYGDLTGEFILSDEKSNLSFTSGSALNCGFSKGTADTEEELAKLLDLPRWHEISDYGRQIAAKWQDTCKKAEEDIPRLLAERGYKNQSGDAISRLNTLIQIDQALIRWWDRAPNVAQGMLPPRETFVREIAELRKQIADMRRGR